MGRHRILLREEYSTSITDERSGERHTFTFTFDYKNIHTQPECDLDVN